MTSNSNRISIEMLPKAAAEVVRNAHYVTINLEKIEQFSCTVNIKANDNWLSQAPSTVYDLPPKKLLAFIFILDSVSFCYWGLPKWHIKTKTGHHLDGAWALIHQIYHAMISGVPLEEPSYLERLTQKQWDQIVGGEGQLQFMAERCEFLNSLGAWINHKYDGAFANVLVQADYSAVIIADNAADLVCFRDDSTVGEMVVPFRKRAQLLAADLAQASENSLLLVDKPITGRDKLSACADYKLPALLREREILSYSVSLAERIDAGAPLLHNSREEIEIRAATIVAVNEITARLNARGANLCPNDVNDYLWMLTQSRKLKKPYHLTPTTAY